MTWKNNSLERETSHFDDVTLLKVSELAYLCSFPDSDEDVWIPRSQIDFELTEIKNAGDFGLIVISEWIAEKKGLLR